MKVVLKPTFIPISIISLIKSGIDEKIIKTKRSEMPKIMYKLNDKEHRYFPDICINNKIYEVKSVYTLKADLAKNIAKMNACIELGYDFQFMVYNVKKNEIIKLSNDEIHTILYR